MCIFRSDHMYLNIFLLLLLFQEREGKTVLQYARNTYDLFIETLKAGREFHCKLSSDPCTEVKYQPFPFTGNLMDDLEMLIEPSSAGIRSQVMMVMETVQQLGGWVEIGRKVFTVSKACLWTINIQICV